MGGMTQTTEQVRPWWRTRAAMVWAGLALVALIAYGLAARAEAQRRDLMVDELYCTLSGIGPFDRAPETGRYCADLLYDD